MQNNGSAVTGSATTLNFVNATSITNSGGDVTITLPTGGGGGGGCSALSGDSDVQITSPSDGDVLTYVAASSKWENKPASGGGVGGGGGAGSGMTPPIVTAMTTETNYSGMTLTQRTTDVTEPCLHVLPTGATDGHIYCIEQAAPAGSWSAVVKCRGSVISSDNDGYHGGGIVVRDATNSYFAAFLISPDSGTPTLWNTLGTGGAGNFGYGSHDNGYGVNSQDLYLHVDWTSAGGGTLVYSSSYNGVDKIFYQSKTGYVSNPGTVGICWTGDYNLNPGGQQGGPEWDFLHWHVGDYGTNGLTAAGGTGTTTLAADTDVSLTSPADGDILTYVAASSKWENKAKSGGVMTPPLASALTAQTNLNSATLTNRASGVLHPCLHVLCDPGLTDTDAVIYCAMAAGAPAGITCKVQPLMYGAPSTEWAGAGICIRDGTNGYIFYFWINASGSDVKVFHTLGTGGGSSFAGGSLDGNQPVTSKDIFLHLDYVTGTQTVVCSISNNGLDKQQVYTMAGVIVNPAYYGIGWSGQYYGPSTGGSAGGPIYDFLHFYAGSSGESGL